MALNCRFFMILRFGERDWNRYPNQPKFPNAEESPWSTSLPARCPYSRRGGGTETTKRSTSCCHWSLQSAALVHEAYLRLIGLNPPERESRTHFFAIAAQLMRQILVDYTRRHRAAKLWVGLWIFEP